MELIDHADEHYWVVSWLLLDGALLMGYSN